MKIKITVTAALMLFIFETSATYACSYEDLCDVKQIAGEIPCVTLGGSEDDCSIVATSTCPLAERPNLILDDGTSYDWIDDQVSFYLGYAPSEGATHTISWTLGDQSGEAVVSATYKPVQQSSDPFDFSSCGGGPLCAAAPPQRPAAPLTALLPLILGALLWRRRTVLSR